ncbi:MAG: hypothetical protein KC535_04945 [Nanoarchaeota archaeon]|nr:hypothetical protein [Nanoarchaeota archaeon]
MVSDDLLKYIRVQQAQGFTDEEIKEFLKKNGYSKEDIKTSFEGLGPRKRILAKGIISLIVVAVLIIIGGISFASWYFSQPLCGNGILETGETSDTCCVDAGCDFGLVCSEGVCISSQTLLESLSVCGDCQYQQGETCVDYECCEDTQCAVGERCAGHECIEIVCGYCEYVDEHSCTSYECCEDAQCPQGTCIDHTCVIS